MRDFMDGIRRLLREAMLALDHALAAGAVENARRAVADAERRQIIDAAAGLPPTGPTLGRIA